MGFRNRQSYTIWNNATPVAITSSTDATPIVVTATAHGFTTGQQVMIYGHATNIAANGIYSVTRLTANTFSLQSINGGANIVGSGAGAGSGGNVIIAPKVPQITDFRNAILQFGTTGTATLTVKVAGSIGVIGASGVTPSCPNFGGTVTPTNPYTFLQVINLDTGAAVNGATGIALSGADANLTFEINVNAMEFITLIPSAWTQGAITAKLLLADNE